MAAPQISPLPPAPSRSDAPAVFVSLADAFIAALAAFVTETNAVADYIDVAADEVGTVLEAAGFSGTSTTSISIGTGSKTITTQPSRGFAPPATIIVASASSPTTRFMMGTVTAYDTATGVLTFTSTYSAGSGSYTDWAIALSGPMGLQGDPEGPAARKTANYTAANGDRLECDTSGGSFTVTLPSAPQEGSIIKFWDGGVSASSGGFRAFPLTVARNGSTIHGATEDLTVSTGGAAFTLEYINSTWRARIG